MRLSRPASHRGTVAPRPNRGLSAMLRLYQALASAARSYLLRTSTTQSQAAPSQAILRYFSFSRARCGKLWGNMADGVITYTLLRYEPSRIIARQRLRSITAGVPSAATTVHRQRSVLSLKGQSHACSDKADEARPQ